MGSWSQAFLANTMETSDKNRDVTDYIFRVQCMFWEERVEKIKRKMSSFFRIDRSMNYIT